MPLPPESGYTGNEPSIPQGNVLERHDGEFFRVSAKEPPPGWLPIFDADHQCVIGYQTPYIGGISRIYDLELRQVGMDEKPLETPWLDPIDIIFIFGSLTRILYRGVMRAGAEIAAETAGRSAARGFAEASVPLLRTLFRRLTERELRFTATTAAHMAESGRYVPISILKLAIRFGKREADPRGVAGAFRYTIEMFREPKVLSALGGVPRKYTLEVVLRESDWTVLHFLYK
jgi:hypothetical protein